MYDIGEPKYDVRQPKFYFVLRIFLWEWPARSFTFRTTCVRGWVPDSKVLTIEPPAYAGGSDLFITQGY